MDFGTFVTEFLLELKNNNKHALTLLNENGEMLKEYLNDEVNTKVLDSFVNDLSTLIVQTEEGKFKLIEKALKHKYLTSVYHHFKESRVMIKAVQSENKNALKWLKSMNVSLYVQDDDGMNVLMHMVKNNKFNSSIKSFTDEITSKQVDKYGRTAIFYAINNSLALWELFESKHVDINHRDNDGNTILIYCCKKENLTPIRGLIKNKVDVNAVDNQGRTAAMYLAQNGNYSLIELQNNKSTESRALYSMITGKHSVFEILRSGKCDINYVNERKESALSLLFKQMYGIAVKTRNEEKYYKCIAVLLSMLLIGCDFNIPVDEDENTALMVILLANDIDTFDFVMKYADKLDFSKKNKNGENVTSLFMKSKSNHLNPDVLNYPSFDFDYADPVSNNNILMYSAISQPSLIPDILKHKPDLINKVNCKRESALIIACKANNNDSVNALLKYSNEINQQDELGNTALYYAVKNQNASMVYNLVKKGADNRMKNNEKKSAYDLATELGDKHVLGAFNSSVEPAVSKSDNNGSLSNDVEEYLYHCISTTLFTNVELNEQMIEMERNVYKGMKKELGLNGKINRGLEFLMSQC